jgi:hypothetical protein
VQPLGSFQTNSAFVKQLNALLLSQPRLVPAKQPPVFASPH